MHWASKDQRRRVAHVAPVAGSADISIPCAGQSQPLADRTHRFSGIEIPHLHYAFSTGVAV
jgi:hypothetical protein